VTSNKLDLKYYLHVGEVVYEAINQYHGYRSTYYPLNGAVPHQPAFHELNNKALILIYKQMLLHSMTKNEVCLIHLGIVYSHALDLPDDDDFVRFAEDNE
jgi:hypothetical protein